MAPAREAGFTALDALLGTLGLATPDEGSSALSARAAAGEDISGAPSTVQDPSQIQAELEATPGFQFSLSQGQQALERSQAARGGLLSGGALLESQRQGQGLASQLFQQRVGNLSNLAGLGQNAAAGSAGASQVAGQQQANIAGTTAANISDLTLARGQAQAQAFAPSAQSSGGGLLGGLSGAVSGAAAGSSFGGIGAAIGGGIGFLSGIF